ncbi:HAD family phosphatase [Dactylosporangium sp. NBC_01737]|uniref:HAD family hydrolase n=1 Tax=Dactylosporangium sp. NBC_01737 TaxID=2975959 RepID=UPI002E14D159|nr:HAD family phosphatase [Dactylosporangium sp. NBC_01737]
MTLRGLLVDYGGVLTTDVFASFDAFCAREGLPPGTVRDLFRDDPAARSLLGGLEDGTLPDAEFEAGFAALLGVPPEGLIERLLGSTTADVAMLDFVRAARGRGIRTGLISNSWGSQRYDRILLDELFDGIVISGDVGVRKPDPAIYVLGAAAIGLQPHECVYVDDLPGNLKPARALGMTTVRHRTPDETLQFLEACLQ